MIKLDFHTHLGVVPKTKKVNSNEKFISPDELVNHFKKFSITHAIIFYDKYERVQEVQKQLPELVVYPIQYISNINMVNDVGKPWCRGIKLHSHRAKIGNNWGVDYNSDEVFNLLNSLPKDYIVYYHTQNPTTYNVCNGYISTLLNNIVKFPWLKHIIGHSGSYGYMTYKPTTQSIHYNQFLQVHIYSATAIHEAVLMANNFDNCFLDTSTFVKYKAEILSGSKKWCVGTDFPFAIDYQKNYDVQLNAYCKVTNQLPEDINQRGIDFIEKSLGIEKVQLKDKKVVIPKIINQNKIF